jgi:hypothetical protein
MTGWRATRTILSICVDRRPKDVVHDTARRVSQDDLILKNLGGLPIQFVG